MPVSENSTLTRPKKWVIALLVAFLLGFIPMAIVAWNRGADASAVRRDLDTAELKNQIATAAMFARRGEYEPARQTVSGLFDRLRIRLEGQADADATQKEIFQKVLQQRDETITLLARSDPAAVGRLDEIQYQLMQALPPEPRTR